VILELGQTIRQFHVLRQAPKTAFAPSYSTPAIMAPAGTGRVKPSTTAMTAFDEGYGLQGRLAGWGR
jgi:methyl-accepting chemotaxis protein